MILKPTFNFEGFNRCDLQDTNLEKSILKLWQMNAALPCHILGAMMRRSI